MTKNNQAEAAAIDRLIKVAQQVKNGGYTGKGISWKEGA
jgi:hypothetical protein